MDVEKNKLPKRKEIRLKTYDYASPGAYFVTICTRKDAPPMWSETNDECTSSVGATCGRPRETNSLSSIGRIVEREIQHLDTVYPHVRLDRYCIMSDHLHLIVRILPDSGGRPQVAPTLGRIVQQFKGRVTKSIGFLIWQKSFYERIIRNEKSYLEISQYIENNPLYRELSRISSNLDIKQE